MLKHLDDYALGQINKLLNAVCERYNWKNDARISHELELSPPTISKFRSGKLILGANTLLRIHDSTGMELSEMKEILTPAIYMQMVWNRKPDESKMPTPWPGQLEVMEKARKSLTSEGYVCLRLGQRSGKSYLAVKLAEEFKYDQICIFSATENEARASYEAFPYIEDHPHVLWQILPEEVKPETRTLVILDEPFWNFGLHNTFQAARKLGVDVIAVGSRGPEWDNVPFWRALPHYVSRSTWQVNPFVTRASLQRHYEQNFAQAQRDFQGF